MSSRYGFRLLSGLTDQFLIVVYDGSTKVKELPVISVSIGLGSAPNNLRRSGDTLSWNLVDGACGYKVGIYHNVEMTDSAESSSLLSQSTASYPYTTLTSGRYYWLVEGVVCDSGGSVAEINAGMAVSPFTLQ